MKWKSITARTLRPLLLVGLLAFGACGDEDDSTSVSIQDPDNENEREEQNGVPGGPTVIVNNRIDNDIRVRNKTRIEDDDIFLDFECDNVDQVIHRQFIHVAVRCPSVPADDTNQDGVLDELEVQQVVGPGVIALDSNVESEAESGFPSGDSYTYQERLPLTDLHQFIPPGQQFAFIIYGVSEETDLPPTYQTVSEDPVHLTVPIFCQVLTSPAEAAGGTTGGTAGGVTGGATGGSGGSDDGGTGGTIGGTGGSSGGTTGGTTGGTGGTSGGTGGTGGSTGGSGGTSGGTTGGTGGSDGGSGGTDGGEEE